jgi:tetratricopeptide (TPR) repeat protein
MLLALVGTASANDRADCVQIADVDRAIRGCTNIITAGRETRHNLAVSYHNRGDAYANKGNYDQAIADENKAIELNPDYAMAYGERGFAYDSKANYDLAIEDETKAIELNPRLAGAYATRGDAFISLPLLRAWSCGLD